MAEASWPSPNHNSRSVTDTEYVRLAPWNSDGVFQSGSDVVYANSSGMQVHVRANQYGIVRGHAWSSGASEYNLTIAANSSGSTRIDTVVLRLDRSTWDVTAAVRQGTAGAGAPALVRNTGDTGLWEIPIADVTVANGAASIAAGNVKARTLWQSGGIRACSVITDIQATLAAGDLVYETPTGRLVYWNGSAGVVLYENTGWASFAPLANWAAGTLLNRVRRVGNVVHMTGAFVRQKSRLVPGSALVSVANLPTGFAPTLQQHNWMAWTTHGGARLRVGTDSSLWVVDVTNTLEVGEAIYIDTTWLQG